MKNIMTIILIGILCLLIGLGLGYSTGRFGLKKDKNISALLNIGKSPLLENITVQLKGKVEKMEKDFVLIKKEENSFKAKIGDVTPSVIKMTRDLNYRSEEEGRKVQELKLEDVKVGDEVTINCTLSKGYWQIMSIAMEEIIPLQPQK